MWQESKEWTKFGGNPPFCLVKCGTCVWSNKVFDVTYCKGVGIDSLVSLWYGCTTGSPRGVTQSTQLPVKAICAAETVNQS